MSCSRTPKPPSPDSFRRALGNREKAFRKIYRKSVTGRVREKAMTVQPRAKLAAGPARQITIYLFEDIYPKREHGREDELWKKPMLPLT